MKQTITRRQFMKKVGLAGAVGFTALTNLNRAEANNQPQEKMRIYCHTVSGDYAFPDAFKTNNSEASPILLSGHDEYFPAVQLLNMLTLGNLKNKYK